RLAHVERLREPGPVQPRDRVADLEPGILDGNRETVPGPGTSKGEHVAAWFEHAQAPRGPHLAPPLERDGAHVAVPLAAHEREVVRRVCHRRIDRGVRQPAHDLDAVPVIQRHTLVFVVRLHDPTPSISNRSSTYFHSDLCSMRHRVTAVSTVDRSSSITPASTSPSIAPLISRLSRSRCRLSGNAHPTSSRTFPGTGFASAATRPIASRIARRFRARTAQWTRRSLLFGTDTSGRVRVMVVTTPAPLLPRRWPTGHARRSLPVPSGCSSPRGG